jgi:hypothetical protein
MTTLMNLMLSIYLADCIVPGRIQNPPEVMPYKRLKFMNRYSWIVDIR